MNYISRIEVVFNRITLFLFIATVTLIEKTLNTVTRIKQSLK